MSRGRALLEAGLVLPILDGLDEIPDAARGHAIASINDAMRPGQRLVITARTSLYRAAVRPDGGIEVGLTGAAGIELCPLDVGVVADYLRESANGPTASARWEPVLAVLAAPSSDVPVARALTTPLMVTLARAIYNPRPGESPTAALPDPAELLDPARFPSRATVEEHLFDAFIPAAYRDHPSPGRRCRWTAEQAERWLVFLATHLNDNLHATTDLAWWEVRYAAPRPLVGAVVGVTAGAAAGVAAWLGPRFGVGFGVALGIGIGMGLVVGFGIRAVRGWSQRAAPGLAGGTIGGLFGGLLAGLAGALGFGFSGGATGGLALSISIGLVVGMCIGPPVGFAGGLGGGIAGGLSSGLLVGFSQGLEASAVNGTMVGIATYFIVSIVGRHRPARGVHWSPVGLVAGLPVGCGMGLAASLTAGPALGVVAGLLVVLAFALAIGLTGTSEDLTAASGPGTVLAQDRRTFCIVALAAAVLAAFISFLVIASTPRSEPNGPQTGPAAAGEGGFQVGFGDGLGGVLGIGIANGVWSSLLLAVLQAAWGSLAIARCWLALRRRLPLHLMSFLADAHEQRGVLRQAGAVYQFRHAELQRRLATRPSRRGRHRRLVDTSHRTRPVDTSHRTRPVDPSHRTQPGPMHPGGRSRDSR